MIIESVNSQANPKSVTATYNSILIQSSTDNSVSFNKVSYTNSLFYKTETKDIKIAQLPTQSFQINKK